MGSTARIGVLLAAIAIGLPAWAFGAEVFDPLARPSAEPMGPASGPGSGGFVPATPTPPAPGLGPTAPPPQRGIGAESLGLEGAPSFCPPPEPNVRPPRYPWYVEADAIMLRRDARDNVPIAALGAPANRVLSTADLDEPFNAGPRILIGHTLNECYQLEGSYFNLAEWDNSAAIRDTTTNALGTGGTLFSPFFGGGLRPVAGLDYNDFVSIQRTSYLQNGELNLRRHVGMPPGRADVSFLFGIRYMGIDESFGYLSTSGVPAPLGTDTNLFTTTTNDLIGPQIGAEVEFFVEQCWWVNFEAKGALCNDSAVQQTTFTQTIGGVPSTSVFRDSQNSTAFVGDLKLTAVYRCSPHFAARFGYQAIWVQDIALAEENFATNVNLLRLGPAQVNNTGRTVYHGPHVGLEFGW
jgi:hypothetical protein